MPDPISASTPWLWGVASTLAAAFLSACATIFVGRKNNEAAVMDGITKRFQLQFDRYDAEIERLERQMADERAACARELQKLRDEIDRLMANPLNAPIQAYTEDDIKRGIPIVRGAVRRQARRKPE